jgi:DNA-binding IscR family transcriptional regulator
MTTVVETEHQELYMSNEILLALQAIREDSEATRVFEELKRSSGTYSGWELARTLGANPETLEKTLSKLKDARVIDSNGQGLDGIYYLTDLAFKLRLMQAA